MERVEESGTLPPRAARKAAARRRRRCRWRLWARRWTVTLVAAGGSVLFLHAGGGGAPGLPAPLLARLAGAWAVVALLFLALGRGGKPGAPQEDICGGPAGAGRVLVVPVRGRGRRPAAVQVGAGRLEVVPVVPPGAAGGGVTVPGFAPRDGGAVWHPPADVVGVALVRPETGPLAGSRGGAGRSGAPAAPPGGGTAAPAPVGTAAVPPAGPGGTRAEAAGPDGGTGRGVALPGVAGLPEVEAATPGAPAAEAPAAPGRPGVAPAPAATAPPAPAAPAAPPAPAPPAPRPRLGRLAQRRTVLGVDVGSHATKVVQVRRGRRGFTVVNFWAFLNPPGAVAEGAVAMAGALAERLGQLAEEFRLRGRPAVSFLGPQKALARVIKLPPMTPEEVAGALRWEAERYVPLPPETSVTDFLIGRAAPGGEEMEVLVVAAPREAVNGLAGVLRQAGLVPAGVEVEPLAAFRALTALGLVAPEGEGLSVLLDLGHSGTRLSVFARGLPVVNRSLRTGGRDFTEAVARGLGWPPERAEAAKRRWGVRPDTPVHPFVTEVLESLLQEIWRTVEFFLLLSKADRVSRVFLYGGNALQPGLAEAVGRHLSARLGERFDVVPPAEGLVRLVAPGEALRLPRHLAALAAELDARFVGALGAALWRG